MIPGAKNPQYVSGMFVLGILGIVGAVFASLGAVVRNQAPLSLLSPRISLRKNKNTYSGWIIAKSSIHQDLVARARARVHVFLFPLSLTLLFPAPALSILR